MKIHLPNNWLPRPYQMPAWQFMIEGGLRYVGVNHRRWGKDKLFLNMAAVKSVQRIGSYWHMLPEASQARKAIWDAVDEYTGERLIDQAFPEALRADTRGTDMFIRFKNGSTWQVVGSDNYDSLIGSPPIGLTFSEYAYANPAAWQKLSPILLNNGGWAAFISTPCGRNHFHGLYEYANSPEGKAEGWMAEVQDVERTYALVMARLAAAKASGKPFRWRGKEYTQIGELRVDQCIEITREFITAEERQLTAQRGAQEAQAIIQQEYYCSFQAAIPGAYYGAIIERMERCNPPLITRVPHDPSFLVECWLDLGISDDTAIWFTQRIGRETRVIDFYESSGVGIDHYIRVLNGKEVSESDAANQRRSQYQYAPHVLPHDAGHRQLSQRGGASFSDVMKKDYRHPNRVVPQTKSLVLSIDKVRRFLPTCVFDEELTKDGLNKMRQYRRVWNPETRAYGLTPLHDFTSHAASAFQTGVDGDQGVSPVVQINERGVKSAWNPYDEPRRGQYAVGAEDDVLGRW